MILPDSKLTEEVNKRIEGVKSELRIVTKEKNEFSENVIKLNEKNKIIKIKNLKLKIKIYNLEISNSELKSQIDRLHEEINSYDEGNS
jgi:septal ring factor EnvC (AmiA/AmiB activator)